MASVTRENIGLLNDKLTVQLQKDDYYPQFEQSLKKYAKSANIPGFRKGMVPSGLLKKMYGQGVFSEEVIRKVEAELNAYLQKEKVDIFAQPLPMDTDASKLDMNQPGEYSFSFEIGLKPAIEIDPKNIKVTRYKIEVTDAMVQEEVERLQNRNGKMTEPSAVESEDSILNLHFTELDEAGNEKEEGISKDDSLLVKYFAPAVRTQWMGKQKDDSLVFSLQDAFEDKERDVILTDLGLGKEDAGRQFRMKITKVGFVEKAPVDENLFKAVYPAKEITSEADFRAAISEDIAAGFYSQARNQLFDQIYHQLVDHTEMTFPESFLKRWLQFGGEKPKTAEEAEQDYPVFANQLKWTLISSKLIADNQIEVQPDDIRDFAKQQLFSYMGGQMGALEDNQQWVEDYANRMLQDRKYVEDSYHRISTDKLFALLETQVTVDEAPISAEAFAEKLHHHHH